MREFILLYAADKAFLYLGRIKCLRNTIKATYGISPPTLRLRCSEVGGSRMSERKFRTRKRVVAE